MERILPDCLCKAAVVPDSFYPIEKMRQYTHLGIVRHYEKGSSVVLPGEMVSKLIFVLAGRLRIYLMTDDGREKFVYSAGQFALVSRLFSTENRFYHIKAVENSEICCFTWPQLLQVFREDENLILEVIKNYNSKVSYFMNLVKEMDFYNPTIRILRLLYELGLAQGKPAGNALEVKIALPQNSIAEITGAHYVTVSKVLNCLKKENILDKKKDKIVIYDLDRLKGLTHETTYY